MATYIDATKTVSMKTRLHQPGFANDLRAYCKQLALAFPDPAEIENWQVYRYYLGLEGQVMDWDILALHSEDGTLLGAIQFQVRRVPGHWLRKVIWAEHIWLVTSKEARNFKNLMTLLQIAEKAFMATGAQLAFFEFNDRAKMSSEEIALDVKSGVTPELRELMWARFGAYLLVDQRGLVAPYNQPGMGGEKPVRYLSMGFFPLNCRPLEGNRLLVRDYKALLRAGHSSIMGIRNDDPTMHQNDKILDGFIGEGMNTLRFVRMSMTTVTRIANDRLTVPPLGTRKRAA
jgi:hypothetical protein